MHLEACNCIGLNVNKWTKSRPTNEENYNKFKAFVSVQSNVPLDFCRFNGCRVGTLCKLLIRKSDNRLTLCVGFCTMFSAQDLVIVDVNN